MMEAKVIRYRSSGNCIFKLFPLLLSFLIFSATAFSAESDKEVKAEITRLLQKFPKDFNAKNYQGACALFAPDLIAEYPGVPDTTYKKMCDQLSDLLTKPGITLHYSAPKIDQILVEGNIAIVRVVWILTTSCKDQPDVVIAEKSLDIFRRQKDGSWKLAMFYCFPEPISTEN